MGKWYKKGDKGPEDTGGSTLPKSSFRNDDGTLKDSGSHHGGMWPGGIVANYKGYDIEARYTPGGHLYYQSGGCIGKTIGEVEMCLDSYIADMQKQSQPKPPELPSSGLASNTPKPGVLLAPKALNPNRISNEPTAKLWGCSPRKLPNNRVPSQDTQLQVECLAEAQNKPCKRPLETSPKVQWEPTETTQPPELKSPRT